MTFETSSPVISVPSTPPLSTSASTSSRTNSLVVASLPVAFFHPTVLDALRSYFASFGEIYAWAPIRSFARVILVYYSEDDAENAKAGANGVRLEATSASPETVLHVYRADPTPIHPLSGSSSPTSKTKFSPYHLRPPTVERNFLISPPGSPPVGWEPIREEPPNNTPLAEDLIFALCRLQFSQEIEERPGSAGVSVLIEPEEGPGVGVYVEDCGDPDVDSDVSDSDSPSQEEGWFYGQPIGGRRFAPAPTMRPPMPTSA
ncbi:Calcipressin [Fomitiporia mediterranea MF3/22]|uniref:Calcipressin n=1 Tax=Fomitiporia mediterranea (strain MF3/22) TaxID=694068 RepID=UPI0004409C91|nr:Calcipressin [Fomitiporia mediterranea MF3/22]EJD06250.1 Calcipressin [Fomitiporia mediterranea MF3/22]